MHIKYNLGETEVPVNCWVDLENREVTLVMYQDVNIVDVLDIVTLDKMVLEAEHQFKEWINEP
jgi:hypothetical protein